MLAFWSPSTAAHFVLLVVIKSGNGTQEEDSRQKKCFKPPVVYSTDRSKAVVPVLVLLFVALWFILRGYLMSVLPCVILFLCFSVLLALRSPRLGKRELILLLFVRLFDLRLFWFICSSSSWCLGRAAVCDCGTPWTFFLPFFFNSTNRSKAVVPVIALLFAAL